MFTHASFRNAFCFLIFFLLAFSARSQSPEPRALDEAARAECAAWLTQNAEEPTSYVAGKLADYDLILLGEIHMIKESCELVSSTIPSLHAAGADLLCTEFIRSRFNQPLAEIVTAPTYDEAAVVDIFRQGPWPTWGFQEYMDIVRAVWAHNQQLPRHEQPFLIIGIDGEWKQVDLFHASTRQERMAMIGARELHMAGVIEREVFAKKRKALVHLGFAHTARHGHRLANMLARQHDGQIFQVCLHHEMPGGEGGNALVRFLESIIAEQKLGAVAFDVVRSPLAGLRDGNGFYFRFLGEGATFQDFAQGYVFLAPTGKLRRVSWVPGFITDDTFLEANEIATRVGYVAKDQCKTAAELDAALAHQFPPH